MLENALKNINNNSSLLTRQTLDIEKNFALILTATICVDNIRRVYPSDKNMREDQYLNTLRYYLDNHPRVKKIIFIENSNSSLTHFQKIAQENNPHNKKIEFISLETNLLYSHKGKGFGECLLIEKGFKQSQLLNTVTHFGKLTGRLCLTNLTKILESVNPNFDCICDYKDQGYKLKKMWNKSGRPFCDTRFIAFSRKFYQEHLESLHTEFVGKFPKKYFCIEPEFYQKIHLLENQAQIIKRFKVEPKFLGISGHSGSKKYGGKNNDGLTEQVKYQLRTLIRKVAPWLYI